MENMEFGSYQVADILQVDRTRLRQYMLQGYLPEGRTIEHGSTTRTLFSRRDIQQIATVDQLLRIGVSPRFAAGIADWVYHNAEPQLPGWVVIRGFEPDGLGRYAPLATVGNTLRGFKKAVKSYPGAIMIHMAELVLQVDQKINGYMQMKGMSDANE